MLHTTLQCLSHTTAQKSCLLLLLNPLSLGLFLLVGQLAIRVQINGIAQPHVMKNKREMHDM